MNRGIGCLIIIIILNPCQLVLYETVNWLWMKSSPLTYEWRIGYLWEHLEELWLMGWECWDLSPDLLDSVWPTRQNGIQWILVKLLKNGADWGEDWPISRFWRGFHHRKECSLFQWFESYSTLKTPVSHGSLKFVEWTVRRTPFLRTLTNVQCCYTCIKLTILSLERVREERQKSKMYIPTWMGKELTARLLKDRHDS
jgi:hypothetical protein